MNARIVQCQLPTVTWDSLMKVIEDEIKVASSKWSVSLTDEEREKVATAAFDQVVSLVNLGVGDKQWTPNESVLNVRLAGDVEGDYLLRRNGYNFLAVHPEPDEDVKDLFPETDLPTVLDEVLYGWARTAAFYGVGSYR